MRKLLLVLITGPVFAQGNGVPEEIAAEFQAVLDAPHGTFRGAAGYADVGAEIAMQSDDAFRIGSITKTFTSVVILQLMEEGTLSLDDTVIDWLPTTPLPNADDIIIPQLLNHTAGTFNYTDDEDLTVDVLIGDGEPNDELFLRSLVVYDLTIHSGTSIL